MASVFLSYDRDDADKARPIASALEKAGHSVWWDLHVRGGAQFSKVIEEALKAADVVVVLWSANSVESAWVRDEAAAGRDRGRLVPATIDGTEAPLGFRQFQTIDLTDWKRGTRGRGCKELQGAIADIVGLSARPAAGAASVAPRRERVRARALSITAVVLLAMVGLASWYSLGRSSSVPVVAVAPANASASADELARDLLVRLGSLGSARTDYFRLTAASAERAPTADFIFQTAASNDSGGNLALIAGKDHSLLWSKDFHAPNRSALEQMMAYTAGQVLGCAVEATDRSGAHLDEQTLKLYLGGCALFGERYRTELQSVAPIFTQVLARAPKFEPAWAKLLLAEAQTTRVEMLFNHHWAPGALPEHIRAVERLNPRIAELYIAKSALLPIAAFAPRQQLIDEASRFDSDNPHLLVFRSEFLEWVGRNDEAVRDAARAAELDPLSAGFESNHIQTLAYAGRLDAAWQRLARAEQLWPGTPTIEDARFRLYSRFGDAREALRMARSKGLYHLTMSPDIDAFLVARIDPTPVNVERAIVATRSAELPAQRQMAELAQVLGEFHREEELFRTLLNWPLLDRSGEISSVFFRPALRNFRRDPRFIAIAKHLGLLDYWRTSGKWPDFCFEPDLPYDCKKEAARLAAPAG